MFLFQHNCDDMGMHLAEFSENTEQFVGIKSQLGG